MSTARQPTYTLVPGLVSGRVRGEQRAPALHQLALQVGPHQRRHEREDSGRRGAVPLLQLAARRRGHVFHALAHRFG